MEFIHDVEGDGCTVHVLDINVRGVKTFFDQRDVTLGFVAEKFGAPNPRLSGCGRFWNDDETFATVHGEIEFVEPFPHGLDRLGSGRCCDGHDHQSKKERLGDFHTRNPEWFRSQKPVPDRPDMYRLNYTEYGAM